MKQLDYSKMSPKDRRQMLQEVYVVSLPAPLSTTHTVSSAHRSILDSLNHPNVVMLYDKILDKEEQKIYILMEVSQHVHTLGSSMTNFQMSSFAVAETWAESSFLTNGAANQSVKTRSGSTLHSLSSPCIIAIGQRTEIGSQRIHFQLLQLLCLTHMESET